MTEVWAPVVGYEGLYQVSNLGRVKSLTRRIKHGNSSYLRKGRLLSQVPNKDGYLTVPLNKNSKCKVSRVHRLVAEAFIPNPDNLPEVNHIDENKQNNCLDNLEWCTHKYNSNYGTCQKRRISKVVGSKRSADCRKRMSEAQYKSWREVRSR